MGKRKLRRRWVLLAGLLLVVLIGTVAGDGDTGGGTAQVATADEQAAQLGEPTPAASPGEITTDATATPDPGAEARALAKRGRYDAAIAAYEAAGLDDEADRVRRRGARALNRSAQRALTRGRHATAKRLATRSRRLHRTSAARTIITSANAEIARVAAAKRERERIARDRRSCSSAEKRLVDAGGARPPGCEEYEPEPPAEDCHPSYEGACLKPDSPDYDCDGGSGNGPDYTGPVRVVGDDPYDLDADGDGIGCQNS
jgi:hypothetical protein